MNTLTREEYLLRMKGSRQFSYFGIQPIWRPGERDIDGFCHDEVVRQFHDTRVREDGGVRVDGMLAAWEYARSREALPTVDDVLRLGHMIEPSVNVGGFRLMQVYIGTDTGAPPGLVPPMMNTLMAVVDKVKPVTGREGPPPAEYRALWKHMGTTNDRILRQFAELVDDIVTADDFYLAFEAVHPFGDGNGRTGKVLHNWILHTLDDPVLVEDYWPVGGNP